MKPLGKTDYMMDVTDKVRINRQQLQSMVWAGCKNKEVIVQNFAHEFQSRLSAIGLEATGTVFDIRLDQDFLYDIHLRYTFSDGALMVVWPNCPNGCKTQWPVTSVDEIIEAFEAGKEHHISCPKQSQYVISCKRVDI